MINNCSQFVITVLLVVLTFATKLQAQERVVEISYIQNPDNSVDFFYEKSKPGSYTVKLKFDSMSNTDYTDYNEVVQGNRGKLLTLRPIHKEQEIGFSYSSFYFFGNAKPRVDSLFQYVLPFKKGKKYKIFESSNLNEKYFGAEKPETWKSYYVSSKTADTVFAMRKGIVVELENLYQADTLITGYVYSSKINSIVIEHADGTYASYKGIKKDSFKVKLGDVVYPNTALGVLDIFNNKMYNLHFNIYYIGKEDNIFNEAKTIKTAKTAYDYLTPYFYTAEGITKITSQNDFTSDYTDAILTKELTKKELKQRMKKI